MGGLSSLVGNLTGGLIGTSDAEKAAKQAAVISKEAKKDILAELDLTWDDIEGWLNPYLEAGNEALGQYKEAIGAAPDAPVFDSFNFDYTKMEDNPAYQFVRDQGMQAMNRIQAKNRALTSGNRITGTADYMSGLASTEYENEFRRQLLTSQQNNAVKGLNFDAKNLLYNQDMQNLNYLTTMGANTAGNMSSFRNMIGSGRNAATANNAAEVVAASLIPVQEKQAFVNNLISSAAAAYGGGGGGGGGPSSTYQPYTPRPPTTPNSWYSG